MNTEQNPILREVRKAIVGKDDVLQKVLAAMLAGGHVLLDDVPGVGKTTLALAFSRALGLDYRRIQFTSDTTPSDVTGFSLFDPEQRMFRYQPGPVMTQLLLADEINRTSSKTQAALLEVMEERRVTVDGTTHALPEPFLVLATQNPVGSAGTQLLPPSQLDRFMVRLSMGYPDLASQVAILRDRYVQNPLDRVEPVCDAAAFCAMQRAAAAVHTADAVYEYIARLAEATRTRESIELGLSPRGALALCRFAQATAYLRGRSYVIPPDVADAFVPVAAHRLVLTRAARIAGTSAEAEAAAVLHDTPMPPIAAAEPANV